jgi:uncharacterized protein with FMN-binding domain
VGVAVFAALGASLLHTANAVDSLPLPPDVDPATLDITASDGTTVHVVNASLSLSTTVDKSVVTPGTRVTYSYAVSGTGASFQNVRVEDDKCEPVVLASGDVNGDKVLQPTEAWKFTCSTTVLKDQTNKAVVHGGLVLDSVTPTATPTPTSTSTPTTSPSPTPTVPPSSPAATSWKDGTYTGALIHVTVTGEGVAYDMQVQAVIAGGKITAITVPVHTETDSTSKAIFKTQVATSAAFNLDPTLNGPTMIYEALQGQTSNIATVAGASFTTTGFKTSLASALALAAA